MPPDASVLEKDEPPTHVPEIAKQPVVMLNPTFEVEVAEPEIVRPETVVVPKPEPETENLVVDASLRSIRFPVKPVSASAAISVVEVSEPATESLAKGEVVPMPIFEPEIESVDVPETAVPLPA